MVMIKGDEKEKKRKKNITSMKAFSIFPKHLSSSEASTLIDTPLLYLGVYLFRKKFDLEINEEIDI